MHLTSKTVSPEFRLFMLQQYPALEHNLTYLRLMEHILFGTIDDEETGQRRISRAVLAHIEGREDALQQHRYVASPFLTAFRRDVMDFEMADRCYAEGRARTIKHTAFPAAVLDAMRHEQHQILRPDRVYFTTGKPFTRHSQAEAREEARAEALRRRGEAPNPATGMLLDYMNDRPSHRFTHMLQHLPQALAVAELIKDPVVRARELRLLRAIRDQPQPFYKPTARSARIYALNESVFRCTREVRKILTQDWVYFDLRSAQLAICAADWEVAEMMDFLKTDQNIWDEFGSFLEVGRDPDMKSVFKKGGYATTFGAGDKGVFKIFDTAGRTRPEARLFLDHPLMRAMLKKRLERMNEILREGGARDCFGTRIPIPWTRYGKGRRYVSRRNPRSVLAQLAQACELQLMLPIVELALQTNQFTIMLWLHDGCYIAFRDAERKRLWSKRIEEAVKRQADTLGIPTRLMSDIDYRLKEQGM